MTTSTTSMWALADVVSAISDPTITVVGHLAIGGGRAVLPDVVDGSPVEVSPATALEGLQRYGGHCWIDEESGALVGWPDEDGDGGHDGSPVPAPEPAAPADPAALSTIDLVDWIVEAMYAERQVLIGNLTLGMWRAVLPSAENGAPVAVSAAEAAEAIQRFGGWCWVDERDRLVGWPSGLAGGPEDGPDDGPAAPAAPSTLEAFGVVYDVVDGAAALPLVGNVDEEGVLDGLYISAAGAEARLAVGATMVILRASNGARNARIRVDHDIARHFLEGAVRAVLGDDAVAEASYLQETHRLACARYAIARTGRPWVLGLPLRVVIGAAFDRGRPRPAAWLADQPDVIVWLDEPSGRPDAPTAEALVEDLRAAGGDV